MTTITLTALTSPTPGEQPVEIVERKGIGHPDTICDALADALSQSLCRYYRERFGLVLHHNVDKALLWGGTARTAFGGGEVLAPMEIFLAGRAATEYEGIEVPLEEIVRETGRHWLTGHLHALDAERHVKLHTMIRPGSTDLVELYRRQQQTGVAYANDSSCGCGYAPLDALERVVLAVERGLNAATLKAEQPAIGEDIKVMGVRQDGRIALTVACAFIDRHVADIDAYVALRERVAALAAEFAGAVTDMPVAVAVNDADDIARRSVYLTVTGTSAESGDDGEVGRGNRVNGLITPYRPMNMEAAAGKNPVTHVGKLYNVAAAEIAGRLVGDIEVVREAYCYLVSRIGYPVNDPQVVDVRLRLARGASMDALRPRVESIIGAYLDALSGMQDAVIAGDVPVY